MNDAIKMQISAFVDGELPQNEAELLLRRMCQDRELRQQATEYLSMGRVMRGERSIAGIAKLRERISAVLDDKSMQEEFAVAESKGPRFLRPLAGFAIAATVAMVALLGLQQMTATPDADPVQGNESVVESIDAGYTVPEQGNDQLRDYYLLHNASSSYFGANSINARLVTLRSREGVIGDIGLDEQPLDKDAAEAELQDTSEAQSP